MARGGAQHIPRPDDWRPGSAAPWLGADLAPLTDFGALHRALAERVSPRAPGMHASTFAPAGFDDSARTSAVLIALHDSPDGPSVVLTRRTQHLSSHKGAGVREAIEAAGASLLYLPPYSPDFNPIENAFAKLKAMLRKAAERTVGGLWDSIGRIIDMFPPAECANYFSATGNDAA